MGKAKRANVKESRDEEFQIILWARHFYALGHHTSAKINEHRNKLVVSGNQRSLDEIAPLMKAYQNAGEHVIAAQRQSAAVMGGN